MQHSPPSWAGGGGGGATLTPDPHEDGKEHGPLVVKQMGLLEESAGQQVRESAVRRRGETPPERHAARSATHLTPF